jgi:hypothetical protein
VYDFRQTNRGERLVIAVAKKGTAAPGWKSVGREGVGRVLRKRIDMMASAKSRRAARVSRARRLFGRRSLSAQPSARHLKTFGRPNGGVWRPSPSEGVVARKELKVYFFLPHARPVLVKGGRWGPTRFPLCQKVGGPFGPTAGLRVWRKSLICPKGLPGSVTY